MSEGSWVLSAESQIFWAPAISLVVPKVHDVALDVWPATTIRGAAAFAEKGTVATELLVRFRASDTARPQGPTPEGTITCPIAGERFACTLPAVELDFSVRVRGHVSHFFWAVRLTPEKPYDIGTLLFRRGASLAGRVTSTDKDAPRPGACRVSLQPLEQGTGSDREASRRAFTGSSASVNDKGFFHFEVVPPGEYVLRAVQEGFVPAQAHVTIVEGTESSLKQPLSLSRPLTLEVLVVPPQDGDGKPWSLQLLEFAPDDRTFDIAADLPVAWNGIWKWDRAGGARKYRLRLKSSRDDFWYMDDDAFEMPSGPLQRRLEVSIERLHGTLKLGRRPVAARVVFGTDRGPVSVPFLANENGRFSGAVPHLGRWEVLVDLDAPRIRRVLSVEIAQPAPSSDAEVDLLLPNHALDVELVDEQGAPVTRLTLLNIQRLGKREFVQHRIEGGAFHAEGLDVDHYMVSAEAHDLASDGYEVEIPEEGSPDPLTIVLKKLLSIRGRVVSPSGTGVIGATVKILPTPAFPTQTGWTSTTDAEGRFELGARPDLPRICAVVLPPGFGARMLTLEPSTEEQLVSVDQNTGTLDITQPQSGFSRLSLLFRGACFWYPGAFASVLGGVREEKGTTLRFTVPRMEPGAYALCTIDRPTLATFSAEPPSSTACVTGVLAPFGTLELRK